ncbi:MAG: histidine phosphatase family protein [Clostridiales bacterium]|jgi:2,3-bisphosphoglycerate-dependent phosphoglycerate mutase|nr:histidine phosphatase family protein [Clostridiales bacterium]
MTTIYFIRHAEPDRSSGEDATYSLTEKGLSDCAFVTEFLRDKKIDTVLSSPFKRSSDTVRDFAESFGLPIILIDDFRERKISESLGWISDFETYSRNQWSDFNFKLENGECLSEVQSRNIRALEDVLKQYSGKNIVIGTHGTALSTIINYYDKTYVFENFWEMAHIMPWVVKMEFNKNGCFGMEKIDLFQPYIINDYTPREIRTFPLGELKAYKYNVIFARYQNKWLYCRHKNRDSFETAGGKVKTGETLIDSARRELFEETGAKKFDIEPAFDYSVHLPNIYANGQVFLAHIHELGEMPDFEMCETALFDSIPDKMYRPQILPVLFHRLQHWINSQNSKDELWDILDENRCLTGRTIRRGDADKMKPDEYKLTVFIWILTSDGKLLITQRAPNKGSPGMWENTGGSAVAGDSSLTAAVKEVKEETGLTLQPENGKIIVTGKLKNVFFDVWLFKQDIDLKDIVLQEGETTGAKLVSFSEIETMITENQFVYIDYLRQLRAIIQNELAHTNNIS